MFVFLFSFFFFFSFFSCFLAVAVKCGKLWCLTELIRCYFSLSLFVLTAMDQPAAWSFWRRPPHPVSVPSSIVWGETRRGKRVKVENEGTNKTHRNQRVCTAEITLIDDESERVELGLEHGLGRGGSGVVRSGGGSSHTRWDTGSTSRRPSDCCPGHDQGQGKCRSQSSISVDCGWVSLCFVSHFMNTFHCHPFSPVVGHEFALFFFFFIYFFGTWNSCLAICHLLSSSIYWAGYTALG